MDAIHSKGPRPGWYKRLAKQVDEEISRWPEYLVRESGVNKVERKWAREAAEEISKLNKPTIKDINNIIIKHFEREDYV